MYVETVTLDSIFDVQRRKATRNCAKRTQLSFQAHGIRHYSVVVPGWPEFSRGHLIAFVLRQQGNWQTVEVCKNLTTGELAAPSSTLAISNSIMGACISPIFAMLYPSLNGTVAKGFVIAAVLCILTFAVDQTEKANTSKRTLSILRQL